MLVGVGVSVAVEAEVRVLIQRFSLSLSLSFSLSVCLSLSPLSLSQKLLVPSRSMQQQQPSALCFFWDIQNCAVPSGASPYDRVRAIRAAVTEKRAGGKTAEVSFNANCDVGGLSQNTRAQLGSARVITRDVSSRKAGAADIRLLQDSLYHTMTHHSGIILLISGDIDFAETVHDLVHTAGTRWCSSTTGRSCFLQRENTHAHHSPHRPGKS